MHLPANEGKARGMLSEVNRLQNQLSELRLKSWFALRSTLTPEQLEQIKKDIDANVKTADRLRAVKLKNGDEPDFVFSAE